MEPRGKRKRERSREILRSNVEKEMKRFAAQLRVSWREGPRAEVAGNWFMGVV